MKKLAAGAALWACLLLGAEKKPVDIDALMAQHRPTPPTPIWSPDGTSFALVQEEKVKLYDSATGESKDWFDTTALARQAHHPPTRKPLAGKTAA